MWLPWHPYTVVRNFLASIYRRLLFKKRKLGNDTKRSSGNSTEDAFGERQIVKRSWQLTLATCCFFCSIVQQKLQNLARIIPQSWVILFNSIPSIEQKMRKNNKRLSPVKKLGKHPMDDRRALAVIWACCRVHGSWPANGPMPMKFYFHGDDSDSVSICLAAVQSVCVLYVCAQNY